MADEYDYEDEDDLEEIEDDSEDDSEDEPSITEDVFDVEEILENPGLGQVKSTFERISVRKMVFAGLGLVSPVIIPRMITKMTGYSAVSMGIMGLLVGFLVVVLGTMLVQGIDAAHSDDYLTGGIAGLAVNAFGMAMEWFNTKVSIANGSSVSEIDAKRGIQGSRHELYNPETRGVEVGDVIGDLNNLSREVIAPTFEGIEAIGNGVYLA